MSKFCGYRKFVDTAKLRTIPGKSPADKKTIPVARQYLQRVTHLYLVVLIETRIKDSGSSIETHDKPAVREQSGFFHEQGAFGHGHVVSIELTKAQTQIGLRKCPFICDRDR